MKVKYAALIYFHKFVDDITTITLASTLAPNPSPACGRGESFAPSNLGVNLLLQREKRVKPIAA
jgi:hypothetical protein